MPLGKKTDEVESNYSPHPPQAVPLVSLRLGHAAGLTVHRTVIQHRVAASLPHRRRLCEGRRTGTTTPPPLRGTSPDKGRQGCGNVEGFERDGGRLERGGDYGRAQRPLPYKLQAADGRKVCFPSNQNRWILRITKTKKKHRFRSYATNSRVDSTICTATRELGSRWAKGVFLHMLIF